MKNILISSFKRTLKYSGPLSVFGGLISDVITPLLGVAKILFFISLILAVLLGFLFYYLSLKKFKRNFSWGELIEFEHGEDRTTNRIINGFTFSSISTIVFLIAWVVSSGYPAKGSLASNFQSVENIQSMIGIVQKNQEITQQIKIDTSEIKKDLKTISENIEKIGEGFNPKPQTKGQFYANIEFAHNKGVGLIEKHIRKLLERYPEKLPDYLAQIYTWALINEEKISFVKAHEQTKILVSEYGVTQKIASTWESSVRAAGIQVCDATLSQLGCSLENVSDRCKMTDFLMSCNRY